MTLSAPIRDLREVWLLQDIRKVVRTLGLTFPLSEANAENVARLVRRKQAIRARIKARRERLDGMST